jgi:hypothetical protein
VVCGLTNVGAKVQSLGVVVCKIKTNPVVVRDVVVQELANVLVFFCNRKVVVLCNLGNFRAEIVEHCFFLQK